MAKKLILLFVCASSLHSMEIIPLLEKDYVEKNELHEQEKKIKVKEIRIWAPLNNKKRGFFHPLEIQKKIPECSDTSTCVLKGAGCGGCCGLLTGGTGMYCFSQIDFCLWLCCKNYSFTPIAVLDKIMCYGLPVCTCAGCVAGACCVVTGLSKKMNIDAWFT
jgi:hypothetical protein